MAPTASELARRARRAAMNKYQKKADTNLDGRLNDQERMQAALYEENWDKLNYTTPPASEYGDEEVPTLVAARPIRASGAAVGGMTMVGQAKLGLTAKEMPLDPNTGLPMALNYMGVELGEGKDFGTYAGKCRKWTEPEKVIIKAHMAWKKELEAKWAAKYSCAPVKPKCTYV